MMSRPRQTPMPMPSFALVEGVSAEAGLRACEGSVRISERVIIDESVTKEGEASENLGRFFKLPKGADEVEVITIVICWRSVGLSTIAVSLPDE